MKFRYEVIAEAMKLQGISYPKLEELSGIPASTLKKLTRGESENPGLSTIQPVFRVLGLSIDRACGLAPERDMQAEAAVHNVSMSTALQERLAMQDDKLRDLREALSEKKAEVASLSAKIDAKNESISHRDRIIKSKDKWIAILASLSIAFAICEVISLFLVG